MMIELKSQIALPRISFSTLGCRLNQSETAIMERVCQDSGYRIVEFDESADIAVINTCTVTENGDHDARRLINKAVRQNPKVQIALVGCQAQVQKEKLAQWPNVQWVIGNAVKMELPSILAQYSARGQAHIITPTIDRKPFKISTPAIDRHRTRANLKIQDGCDFFCSFCEIPYARGRARSRDFQNILDEARILAEAGHQEVVLTGINVGTYGFEDKTILQVVEALEKIPDLKRIRISSIEPTTIPWELIEKMQSPGKLCRYLHIPLQSGSDKVLTAMQRKYTVDEFSDFIDRVYQSVPDICLGTDVIVGFPGETAEEFEKTAAHLRQWPLAYFHVFSYSERQMAVSKKLDEQIAPKDIQARSVLLRQLSQRQRQLFLTRQLDKTVSILFEQQKGSLWEGLSDNYLRVRVESTQDLRNTIRDVRVTKIQGAVAMGQIVAHA